MAGSSVRVAQAVKHRDNAIEEINRIADLGSFSSFLEDYKARLGRISDRENQIYMRALLDRLSSSQRLSAEDRGDILQALLQNLSLFMRGSAQFHVPLDLHGNRELFTSFF